MEYIIPIIVALITAIFGPIIVEWVRNKMSKKKDTLGEAIEVNELVNHQLELMMDEIECDRVWLAQFHNGGHFYPTGKSIQKFSIFYEKTTPNTQPIQHTFQNIPVSLFPKAIASLYKEGELSIPSYKEGNETYDLNSVSQNIGTKSFYLIAIDDLEGQFIGVIGIAFNEKEHKLSKDEWIFIRQKAGAIGSLLTNYLKKKK
jgi:hypothetical protein